MPGGRYPWAVRAGGPLLGGGGLPVLARWNPQVGQVLPVGWSFAGLAKWVLTTTTGLQNFYQKTIDNEVPIDGLRKTGTDTYLPTSDTGIPLNEIRFNYGLRNRSVPLDFAIVQGVPNISFDSTVTSPTTLFVRVTGDDGNDGLTLGQAVRTVDKALEIAATSGSNGDGFSVDIGPGRYFQDQVYPTAPSPGRIADFRDIEMIGSGARPVLMNATDPVGVVWNDEGDGTYTTTLTDVSHPVDFGTIDNDNQPTKLTNVADLPALLLATEGYFVVGSVMRLKPIRAGTPDNDMILFLSSLTLVSSFRNRNMYWRNIAWYGFKLAINPSDVPTANIFQQWDNVYAGFTAIAAGDVISVNVGSSDQGLIRFYARDCVVSQAETDGFNYANQTFNVEYRCTCYDFIGQASTGHGSSNQVRIDSSYRDTVGAAVIADIGVNSRTWMVNCSVSNNTNNGDIQNEGDTWLDAIDFTGSASNNSINEIGTPNFYQANNLVGVKGTLPTNYFEFEPPRQAGVRLEGRSVSLVPLASRRDLTQVAWVKTNCTPALDATGIDLAANAASSLTATAANATALIQLVSPLGDHTASFFIARRGFGIGTIEITIDNGATWIDITAGVSEDIANRFVVRGNGTNPIVGVRLGTSGDIIEVDCVQLVIGNYEFSPMLDSDRNFDDLLSTAGIVSDFSYTALADATTPLFPIDGSAAIGNSGSQYSVGTRLDGDPSNAVSGVALRIDANSWLATRKKVSMANPNLSGETAFLSATRETTVSGICSSTDLGPFYIGNRGPGRTNYWNGVIHEVVAYDGAATQDQNESLVA